jgi:NAD(P)-dependent dehydrogenase (short-subunit alcohol dehydrogenase family)
MSGGLAGKRVLVVGASAGIGRATAIEAVRSGAAVVLAARRSEQLDTAVAEAGGGTALVGDVCAEGGAARLVDAAVAALKGASSDRNAGGTDASDGGGAEGVIDVVLYCVGLATLRRLDGTDAATWHATLDANVVGANQVIRAVVPHLAPDGVVAVLSSETTHTPRLGLVPYAASKAALETSLRGWRAEHPTTRFTCVVVGATQPSEFGASFTMPELGEALDSWMRHGLMQERFMHTDDVARVLVGALGTLLTVPGVAIEDLVLRSPSPVAGAGWTPDSAGDVSPPAPS